jgi:membrane-anchored glycerophosphoryl diester phosphodiesterase (GDPDase)
MAKDSAKPQFSKQEAISFGFGLAKKNLFFFVVLFLIIILITAVMTSLRVSTAHVLSSAFLLSIIQAVIDLVVGIGLIHITLKFIDNKKPQYKDLFYYKPIVNYFLASILQGLIVVGGLILLIIPGIFFAIRLQYTSYLVVDKNLGPVEAVKGSWRTTRGNVWNLFFFGILLCLINILGALCLLIGLFVTVPLSMLATAFVYRKLLLQSKAA